MSDKSIVGRGGCEVSYDSTKGSLTLDSGLKRKFAVKVAVFRTYAVPFLAISL